jgi:hypothetical protein
MYLTGDPTTYTFVELVLPGGAKVRFPRLNGGTDYASGIFEHTATPWAGKPRTATTRWAMC